MSNTDGSLPDDPDNESSGKKFIKGFGSAALQIISGMIPLAGGLFSAAAGAWSEHEQQKVSDFLRAWIKMLEDELKEKQQTILEIVARLDIHDEKISERVKSEEYQSILRLAFRKWAGAESETKREYVRNILGNAAATRIVSDDVIKLFLDWLNVYSEIHFMVIADIYQHPGSTRGQIWERLGKGEVREDSAEADLFKLLIRDLSAGGVIRQHRETDYAGNFIHKSAQSSHRKNNRTPSVRTMKSAFDDSESYELTALGQQFVHYAMTELPLKISYDSASDSVHQTESDKSRQ